MEWIQIFRPIWIGIVIVVDIRLSGVGKIVEAWCQQSTSVETSYRRLNSGIAEEASDFTIEHFLADDLEIVFVNERAQDDQQI